MTEPTPQIDPPAPHPTNRDFHLEEWKGLRAEILANSAEARSTERYAVLGSVAVWVWVVGVKQPTYWPALFLPPLLIALGFWRTEALDRTTLVIGKYLARIEDYLGSPVPGGWEHYLRGPVLGEGHTACTKDHTGSRQHLVGRTSKAFWISALLASLLIVAAYLHLNASALSCR